MDGGGLFKTFNNPEFAVFFDVWFSVDGVVQKLQCSVGVKQVDVLGPIFFKFYIAAIMSSWRKLYGC